MKILVIDDDIQILEMLSRMLRGWGYQPRLADSGKSALEKIRQEAFDIIIIDIFLTDSKALELIPVLKFRNPETGFIAMTGYNTKELRRELKNFGITNVMSKPFSQKDLKQVIDDFAGTLSLPPFYSTDKAPISSKGNNQNGTGRTFN